MKDGLDKYFAAVKDSIEGHAKRKGYRRTADANDTNELADFMATIRLNEKLTAMQVHAACECLYKCVEFMHSPRRVHLEKISGWASLAWAITPEDQNEKENAGKL